MDEQRSPVAVVLWVLAGCVVFVVGGLWITQLRSSAEDWETVREDEDLGEPVRTHDTFEDAWKHVWNDGDGPSTHGPPARRVRDRDRVADARPGKSKAAGLQPEETVSAELADATTNRAVASTSDIERESGQHVVEAAALNPASVVEGVSEAEDVTSGSPEAGGLDTLVATASTTPASSGTTVASEVPDTLLDTVARTSSSDVEEVVLSGPVESRVVTLQLSGSVGGKRLSETDGYTWGRIAYFLQRERNPPYFLVRPSGALSGVMGPPAEARPGVRQTVGGMPSMRPGARLGSPLFVIKLLATVESAGAMTFYGRGLAQKYRCLVNAQVVYLGGERPQVVDSFSVSESSTAVQGRVATGPPGTAIYHSAIEKLIARLRGTTYFN